MLSPKILSLVLGFMINLLKKLFSVRVRLIISWLLSNIRLKFDASLKFIGLLNFRFKIWLFLDWKFRFLLAFISFWNSVSFDRMMVLLLFIIRLKLNIVSGLNSIFSWLFNIPTLLVIIPWFMMLIGLELFSSIFIPLSIIPSW